jgi:hypothetical protein
MSKLNSAPAIIVWIFALLAILTPPQVTASGFAALLDVLELLVDEQVPASTGDRRVGPA